MDEEEKNKENTDGKRNGRINGEGEVERYPESISQKSRRAEYTLSLSSIILLPTIFHLRFSFFITFKMT